MIKLWMDLELREDIDDYLTLIYAIEKRYDIPYISINNPSLNEIKLVNYTIKKFALDTEFFISGQITDYGNGKDIHPSLMELISDTENITHQHISFLDYNTCLNGFTVFNGGSLTTLSILIKKFGVEAFNATIQGGFASYEIVESEHLLKKFKKREKVPTWNLNLDLKATDYVLESGIQATFVSKNICHNSFISLDDINNHNTFFYEVAEAYFKDNKYPSKCMHDLLAFLTIANDFVGFKPVSILRTDDERPKFWSIERDESNIKISVSCDFDGFKSLVSY